MEIMIRLSVLALLVVCSYGQKDEHEVQYTCHENSISVTVQKHQFNNYTLKFVNRTENSACMVNENINTTSSNTSHLWISAGHEECGHEITQTDLAVTMVYRLVLNSNSDLQVKTKSLVYREGCNVEYKFECVFQRNLTLSAMQTNVSHMEMDVTKFAKTTEFKVSFSIYSTSDYERAMQTPYTTALGRILYLELELETVREELNLFPQACFATSSPTATNEADKYYLIRNRCPVVDDETTFINNKTRKEYKWQVDVFRYHGSSPLVYLHCNLFVCLSNDTSSECSFCKTNAPVRRKRSAESMTGSTTGKSTTAALLELSSGLIVVRDGTSRTEVVSSSDQNSNTPALEGWTGSIILMVLAVAVVVIFLIAVKSYRSSKKDCQSPVLEQ